MPIKPENRHRYPPDWPQIRAAILARAEHRCEHQDGTGRRCWAVHGALGYWRHVDPPRVPRPPVPPQKLWLWQPLPSTLRDSGVDRPMTIASAEGPLKVIRIVLTIAHLDHVPEHCDPDNLAALCQRHHLAYDQHHHQANAYRTRRAGLAIADLFEGCTESPAP